MLTASWWSAGAAVIHGSRPTRPGTSPFLASLVLGALQFHFPREGFRSRASRLQGGAPSISEKVCLAKNIAFFRPDSLRLVP